MFTVLTKVTYLKHRSSEGTQSTQPGLGYELREKEKEDGTTYEYYEQHAFTR